MVYLSQLVYDLWSMDYKTFQKRVSDRIKALRTEKGITQEEISGLEMGVRVYQRIESGKGSPSLESLFKIAQALGTHPKELLNVSMEDKVKKK